MSRKRHTSEFTWLLYMCLVSHEDLDLYKESSRDPSSTRSMALLSTIVAVAPLELQVLSVVRLGFALLGGLSKLT